MISRTLLVSLRCPMSTNFAQIGRTVGECIFGYVTFELDPKMSMGIPKTKEHCRQRKCLAVGGTLLAWGANTRSQWLEPGGEWLETEPWRGRVLQDEWLPSVLASIHLTLSAVASHWRVWMRTWGQFMVAGELLCEWSLVPVQHSFSAVALECMPHPLTSS